MPLKAIIKKILDDAQEEAETVQTEFQKELEEIVANQNQEIERITAGVMREGEMQGEEKVLKLLSHAERDTKKSLLLLKQELIDEVFQSAYDHVRQMDSKAYRKFVHDLIIKIVETGDEEVIVGEKDAKLQDHSFIEQINIELKKVGKKGELQLGKPSLDIDGGVILRRGRKEMDATLSALFHEARYELESEAANMLLKEES
ncbi:V-type ATP synthase subunit E [bacterium]|nr:V-type ATP synthase subunit E [bacterium]